MAHISGEGWIGKVKLGKDNGESTNYFMWLTIDGQKQRRATGTSDADEAQGKLDEWKAQAKVGYRPDTKLRYEELRDDYIQGGHKIQESVLRDLNTFFKGMIVAAIGRNMDKFRAYRNALDRVVEYRNETLKKEIALRSMKAMTGRRKPLTPAEQKQIELDATKWVDNGVEATTDKRVVYLRAMFYHAFEKTKKINQGDIPYFPVLGQKVDNVKQGKYSEEEFESILEKLSTYLHPLVKFLYKTGMRSGQAKKITWDMIDDRNVLTMPGFLTKNRTPYTLALTDKKGEPFRGTEYLVNMPKKNRLHGEAVFNVDALREEWRQACHDLHLGVYDPKTRCYRGAQLHDFRRTAITNMNAKGKSRTAAKTVSGHKTDSTYNRYGIVELDAQRDAMGD